MKDHDHDYRLCVSQLRQVGVVFMAYYTLILLYMRLSGSNDAPMLCDNSGENHVLRRYGPLFVFNEANI